MIKDGIDFHNVEEMTETEKGWRMSRLPVSVTERMEEGASAVAAYGTGVELRFKIRGDAATIRLRAEEAAEAQTAYIYYGSFQGGWENSSRTILTQETALRVEKPKNLAFLKEVTQERGLAFNPEVVRVVLPYGTCCYLGVEGDVEAPSQEDYPSRTYLAYGSSITHGSLALAMPCTYPFRIAQRFGCDYLNLGSAGSARAEKAIAEYLVSRRDWDFASVELGINMLEKYSRETFEERVREFLAVLGADERPVFVTSIFGCFGSNPQKAADFRSIVKKYAVGKRMVFTDGLELLNDPAMISQDLTHPSLEGIRQIAERWYGVMREYLNREPVLACL